MAMVNRIHDLALVLKPMFKQAKKDKILGAVKFKVAVKGNVEMLEDNIIKTVKLNATITGFSVKEVFIVFDEDGFTRISITSYDKETVLDYVEHLEKRDQVRGNSRQMLNAFNKCIIIADEFNNRFGEGVLNKTKELNEIQDIFELMKD